MAMIVSFTDFGFDGPYLGQVKAVLATLAPAIPVVDLFADVPAFRVKEAAFLLAAYAEGFPPGTVFLCVVDPGVGSPRLPLAVDIDGRWYVGPDNGLFEPLMRRAKRVRPHLIVVPEEPRSATFHGRDVFAPAAARLARGETDHLRPQTDLCRPDWPDDLPAVVYVDRFGNLMTGLRASRLDAKEVLILGQRDIRHARTYSDVPQGTLFWYENANGLAEIAANSANAALQTGAAVGSPVVISR